MKPSRNTAMPAGWKNREWRGNLLLGLGTLVLGPVTGIVIGSLFSHPYAGPITMGCIVWAGQALVVWRYFRLSPRPSLLEGDLPYLPNKFYLIAMMLVVGIPAVLIWHLLLV